MVNAGIVTRHFTWHVNEKLLIIALLKVSYTWALHEKQTFMTFDRHLYPESTTFTLIYSK